MPPVDSTGGGPGGRTEGGSGECTEDGPGERTGDGPGNRIPEGPEHSPPDSPEDSPPDGPEDNPRDGPGDYPPGDPGGRGRISSILLVMRELGLVFAVLESCHSCNVGSLARVVIWPVDGLGHEPNSSAELGHVPRRAESGYVPRRVGCPEAVSGRRTGVFCAIFYCPSAGRCRPARPQSRAPAACSAL